MTFAKVKYSKMKWAWLVAGFFETNHDAQKYSGHRTTGSICPKHTAFPYTAYNGQMENYVILKGKAKCNTSTYPAHSPFLFKCQVCSLPNPYLSFMVFKKPCQGAALKLSCLGLTDILQYKQPASLKKIPQWLHIAQHCNCDVHLD